MKKKVFMLATMLMMCMAGTIVAKGNHTDDNVMNKQSDGTYVVNTTTLAKDVKGFKGATPLKIYIKSNKIVKIEPLTNRESPNYFAKVKQGLLNKWYGMKASKASTAQVDGVTGATFSSKAVKENVKRGAKYYVKNK